MKERGGKPPCPRCHSDRSKVIDSDLEYVAALDDVYLRKRECKACGRRWVTAEHYYETTTIYGIDTQPVAVYPVKVAPPVRSTR